MPSAITAGAMAVVIAIMATVSAHYWDYVWCSDCLAEWASLVTIFSLGIAPFWYLLKREVDKRTEMTTISTGLYLELADARDGLDEDRHDDLMAVRMSDGTSAFFMNRMFNHNMYDSLIYSGRINAVRAELQQQAQDVFQLIKDHNAALRRMRDFENSKGGDLDEEHYRHLDKTDSNLRRRIPALMVVLKREYRIARDEKLRKFDPDYVRPSR